MPPLSNLGRNKHGRRFGKIAVVQGQPLTMLTHCVGALQVGRLLYIHAQFDKAPTSAAKYLRLLELSTVGNLVCKNSGLHGLLHVIDAIRNFSLWYLSTGDAS